MILFYNELTAYETRNMLHDVQLVFVCDRRGTSECMEPPFACPERV